MNKKRFEKLFNKKAWGEIISGLFSAVSLILDITGFAPNVHWQWFAIACFVIFVILVYRRMFEFVERIDVIENARPKIIAFEPRFPAHSIIRKTYKLSKIENLVEKEARNLTVNTTTTVFTSEDVDKIFENIEEKEKYTFAVVDFNNQPQEPAESSRALNVAAWLTFFSYDDSHPVLEDLPGRWWSNDEIDPFENPREKERTDILPNKQKVTLALAFVDGKTIYAYNNESHKTVKGAKEFRVAKFRLGTKKYVVRVILSGINLKDDEYWFSLCVDKMGQLSSSKIEKPNWVEHSFYSVS